jgi:hypothetical protein
MSQRIVMPPKPRGMAARLTPSVPRGRRVIEINRGGVDNYLQVITAQTIALMNERNEIDIQRRRMDASALLVKTDGGGWNISQLQRL